MTGGPRGDNAPRDTVICRIHLLARGGEAGTQFLSLNTSNSIAVTEETRNLVQGLLECISRLKVWRSPDSPV